MCVYVCCGSSLPGDLSCAVWPAGVAACVCVCVFAIWPAGLTNMYVCFVNLSYCDFLCLDSLPLVHCRRLIVE